MIRPFPRKCPESTSPECAETVIPAKFGFEGNSNSKARMYGVYDGEKRRNTRLSA